MLQKKLNVLLLSSIVVLLLFDYVVPNTSLWFLQADSVVPCLRHTVENPCEVGFFLLALGFLGYLFASVVWSATKSDPARSVVSIRASQIMVITTGIYLLRCAVSLVTTYSDHHWQLDGASLICAAVICGGYSAWILRTHLRLLLSLVLGFIVIQAVWGIILYLANIGPQFVSGTVHRLGGTFNDPAAVYPFLTVGVPISLTLVLSTEKSILRPLYMLSGLIVFVALMLTWYRAGTAALTIATLLQWFALRRLSRPADAPNEAPTRRPVGLPLFAKMVLPIFVMSTMLVFTTRTQGVRNHISSQLSIEGRYRVWKIGGEQVRQNLVFGTGIGSVRIPTYVERPDGTVFFRVTEFPLAHNQVLQWCIEMGVFGIAFFVSLCYYLVCLLSARPRNIEQIGVATSLIALLIMGLVDVVGDVATPQYVGGTALFFFLLSTLLFQEEAR